MLLPFGTTKSNKSSTSITSTKSKSSSLVRSGFSASALARSTYGSIISITGIDPDIPLKHVLSQVRGGVLERVSQANDLIVLHFVDRKAAQKFAVYANQGHFAIEGAPVFPQKPTVAQRTRGDDYERLLHQGARRVLKVRRPVYDHSSARRLIHSRMSLPWLERVFEPYGEVISVQPMICRDEVAFEVHYSDIASAIKAKRLFDKQSAGFAELSGWSVSFSRDPAERNCYVSI